MLYDVEDEVPDEPYTIPFGEARLTREGDDVTIVAFGRMVRFADRPPTSSRRRASVAP